MPPTDTAHRHTGLPLYETLPHASPLSHHADVVDLQAYVDLSLTPPTSAGRLRQLPSGPVPGVVEGRINQPTFVPALFPYEAWRSGLQPDVVATVHALAIPVGMTTLRARVPDELADAARRRADDQGMSLSRYLAELVQQDLARADEAAFWADVRATMGTAQVRVWQAAESEQFAPALKDGLEPEGWSDLL